MKINGSGEKLMLALKKCSWKLFLLNLLSTLWFVKELWLTSVDRDVEKGVGWQAWT